MEEEHPNTTIYTSYELPSILLFFTISLLTAHILTPYPLTSLGKRPSANGIWTNLLTVPPFGTKSSSSHSTWGYDSSLASFHPFWRISFHICGLILLDGVFREVVLDWILSFFFFFFFFAIDSDTKDASSSSSAVWIRNVATIVFRLGLFLFYTQHTRFQKGVSHPGGPREHKIRRVPQWDDVTTPFQNDDSAAGGETKWRCAVAQDSHRSTLKRFGLKPTDGENGIKSGTVGLSGEPFGRQMWTTDPREDDCDDDDRHHQEHCGANAKKKDDDALREVIRKLASGGRTGFNPSINPNSADVPFREQMITDFVRRGGTLPSFSTSSDTTTEGEEQQEEGNTLENAMKKAVHFYSMLQTEDGHWAGDYGGPHFLMSGLIIAWYAMGQPPQLLDSDQCAQMSRYLKLHQQSDGGWGTHIESPSTMFGTVLCYVALRLLEQPHDNSDREYMVKGRNFIQQHGGATLTGSWAKFWLCLLGCMEWEGHNAVPPEMWLLPNWFPFHPGRLWCHCRMVYLPMGYLYGVRFVYPGAETDKVVLSLRKELYCQSYDTIPWTETRHLIAEMDNYSPIPLFMKTAQNLLALYENWAVFQPFKRCVRRLGLKFCAEYMAAEDLQTNFIDIGPVNKALNMLSAYHVANNDINHATVKNHMMRVQDYLWVAEDGMKMQGYNGSQCWDTSFAIQAIGECRLLDEFPSLSKKAWSYFERTQILSTETSQSSAAFRYESAFYRNRYYRHISKGGWPFSTSAHGWPISDCTGEGLKAVLVLMKTSIVSAAVEERSLRKIDVSRLQEAVDILLTYQNEDGGWATYENNRGYGWYEQLNPSEVFGDIMIDYSYVECSMASLTGLVMFHKMYPKYRSEEIQLSIRLGRDFIKSIQREDGSWYGSWACCFCYGCWFGIEGLVQSGESVTSPAIQRCCRFLLSRQRSNGGWGEDFTSCYDKDYAEDGMASYGDQGSGVVNTGWALLALAEAKCDNIEAIRRGVRYLMKRQLSCGDWPQEGIAGVFNRACGITYTSYRNVFPMWALGRCSETYGDTLGL